MAKLIDKNVMLIGLGVGMILVSAMTYAMSPPITSGTAIAGGMLAAMGIKGKL